MIIFEGVSLPVTDLDCSISFYESVGFTTELRTDQFALMRLGTGTLGLLRLGDSVTEEGVAQHRLRSFVQIELSVDNLDDLYADLTGRGVRVHIPPRDRGFEKQMQLRDPDGFTVEFAEGRRGHNATTTG